MTHMNKLILLSLSTIALSGGVVSAATASPPVEEPKAIKIVKPQVPYDFMRSGVTGEVEVAFEINASGEPENVRVLSSSNKIYAELVKQAVAKWKFEQPGVLGVEYHLPVVFN